jgi:hypothetical protein
VSLEITTRTRVVGFHRWPDAPEHLSHLATRHRHEFRISVTVAVEHSERAVEFHELRAVVEQLLPNLADGGAFHPGSTREVWAGYEFGSRSCETIAGGIAGHLEHLGYRVLSVTVSEDGENDATWRHDSPDARDARTTAIPAQSAALPPVGAGR